jgi:hypothetical protein
MASFDMSSSGKIQIRYLEAGRRRPNKHRYRNRKIGLSIQPVSPGPRISGPRRDRCSLRVAVVIELRFHVEALNDVAMSRTDRMAMLRGQLTVILRRAESGAPVSIEAIARAERVARTLEVTEVSL